MRRKKAKISCPAESGKRCAKCICRPKGKIQTRFKYKCIKRKRILPTYALELSIRHKKKGGEFYHFRKEMMGRKMKNMNSAYFWLGIN